MGKSHPPDSHRSIMRSTSVMAVGTLSSRILGFLRDIILATLFGTGIRADAFFVAQKIPNLFRDLVGEGAANSAVVPVLSEYKAKKTKEEFWVFVNVISVLAMIVLSVLTILGVLLAPLIVQLIAPGFRADPEKFALTVNLTRLMFPYLVMIGLTAHSVAILMTFRSFTAPAFSPCLMNAAVILSALMSAAMMEEPVYGLAVGVLVGGVLQLAVQIRPMMREGMTFIKPKTFKHPGAAQIGRLLVPRLFGAGVYQLTVLIDTFCASLGSIVGPGGISAIYYSNRIIQFPMGVFTVALASVLLPSMSGMASINDTEKLKETLVFSLENIFFVLFPSSIMMILLAMPIIQVLFQRGEFDLYSTLITSGALTFYAFGLFSFGGIKILVTAFHALQDTKTPVKVAAICLLINATLNFILMYPLQVSGIALASSIAATVDFAILFYLIEKRLGGLNSGLKKFVLKILAATILTGIAVYAFWMFLDFLPAVLSLALAGLSGIVIYEWLCLRMNIPQAKKIMEAIQRAGFKGFRI